MTILAKNEGLMFDCGIKAHFSKQLLLISQKFNTAFTLLLKSVVRSSAYCPDYVMIKASFLTDKVSRSKYIIKPDSVR